MEKLFPSGTVFGLFVRIRRLEQGLSQPVLGKIIGMPQSRISEIERGVHKTHHRGVIFRLARGLQCDPKMLFWFFPANLFQWREISEATYLTKLKNCRGSLGFFYRCCRIRKGLTLNALAKKLDCSKSVLSRFETGQNHGSGFTSKDLAILAHAVNVEKALLKSLLQVRSIHVTLANKSSFGKQLRKARFEKKLTLAEAGEFLGISSSWLSLIERNRNVFYDSELLDRFQAFYRINIPEKIRKLARSTHNLGSD